VDNAVALSIERLKLFEDRCIHNPFARARR
jgi:hypothetical protein